MTTPDRLPKLVRSYLERVLPKGANVPAQLRITQRGKMHMKPGGRATRFTATERFAVDRVAFVWVARFPILPAVSLKVLDSYANGVGTLRVRALGMPVQTRAGPEMAVSEAYRYLAELPWVPHAMLTNEHLHWRDVDDRHVEVTTRVADEQPTVRLDFDAAGDIVRSSADGRPRDTGGTLRPTRWGGDFSDYVTLGGIRMPAAGEVYWDLPAGRFVYWRARITSVAGTNRPFEPG